MPKENERPSIESAETGKEAPESALTREQAADLIDQQDEQLRRDADGVEGGQEIVEEARRDAETTLEGAVDIDAEIADLEELIKEAQQVIDDDGEAFDRMRNEVKKLQQEVERLDKKKEALLKDVKAPRYKDANGRSSVDHTKYQKMLASAEEDFGKKTEVETLRAKAETARKDMRERMYSPERERRLKDARAAIEDAQATLKGKRAEKNKAA